VVLVVFEFNEVFMSRVNILFLLSILMFCSCIAFGQEKINSSFEMSGDNKILIYYELKGDSDQVYDVSVVLKRTSIALFEYAPLALQGAIGTGKFASNKETITWALNKKELEMFAEGEDYYFQVKALKKSGGSSWLYWVGGIVLGGATAAVLLLKKGSSDNSSSSNQGLATPPGRP
jgi:hypothetical protein